MISDPILLKAMLIVAKATMIFQAALLFYFYGKDEKVPYAARNIFFVIANAGCLFLAGGIFLETIEECIFCKDGNLVNRENENQERTLH